MTRILLGFVLMLFPVVSFAHEMGIEIKLKETEVQVIVFFEDDTPAQEAKVTLKDETQKVVLMGKTNAKGVWTFVTPKPGKYTIHADAGDKHNAKTTLTIPAPK